MTPEAIAALLGLTVAEIAGARGIATELRALGSIATNFLSLINLARKTTDLLSTYTPSQLYRLTQFWTSPGYYLSMLPDTAAIPLGFIGKLPRAPTGELGEDNFRYDVYVTVYFPNGNKQTFGISVDVPDPISEQEARALAWLQLMERFSERSRAEGGENPLAAFHPDFDVKAVHQLTGRA